ALPEPDSAKTVETREEAQVLIPGQLGIEADLLGREPDEGADGPHVGAQARAEDPSVTRGRREEGGEHRERGRLAGAVRPQQSHGLAFRDAQRDAANRLDVIEGAPKVVEVHTRRLAHAPRLIPEATMAEKSGSVSAGRGPAVAAVERVARVPGPCVPARAFRRESCERPPWCIRGREQRRSHQGEAR